MEKNKHPHKNLEAWKKAMDLAVEIYRITTLFPRDEIYGIVSQMRRAAVSVPSNIAEGAGRRTDKEFVHFLSISIGSLSELDTQMELSYRLKYITLENLGQVAANIDDCKAIIYGLRKKILLRNKER